MARSDDQRENLSTMRERLARAGERDAPRSAWARALNPDDERFERGDATEPAEDPDTLDASLYEDVVGKPRQHYRAQPDAGVDTSQRPRNRSGAPARYGDSITLVSADFVPADDIEVEIAPRSARARAYQSLHTQLSARVNSNRDFGALAVTSFDAGVGRSAVAANLAVLFARSGMRVLLIDADFHAPCQDALFGARGSAGLGDWICGRDSLHGLVFDELPGLTLIPAGRGGSGLSEKLAHPGFRRWLQRLGSGKDLVVLIDTAAAAHAIETESICAAAGGALVVTRRNRSRVSESAAYLDGLRDRDVSLLGAALTG